ncbi:putative BIFUNCTIONAL PENICILLIN-BINDING PROTEIN 1A/1B PONA1 domain protein [Mycobacterium kansasii 732]|nr:putative BIFUNCTIONAL PENICILLIN-BINDING PROTEIN 1A/1B PONA1 domain protein [Mycobacterium kansasii 732]
MTDDRPGHSNPIEEVRAALDNPPSTPLLRDPLEQVKAALNSPEPRPRDERLSGAGGPPGPPGPPGRPGQRGPAGARSPRPRPDWVQQVSWKWVRRSAGLAAAAIVLLPIITFTMAYFIVDVPRPGDIRTNQVSTILASDGSEIAKIVPPKAIALTSTSAKFRYTYARR